MAKESNSGSPKPIKNASSAKTSKEEGKHKEKANSEVQEEEPEEVAKTLDEMIAEEIERDEKYIMSFTNKKDKEVKHRPKGERGAIDTVKMRDDIDTYDEGEKDPLFYHDESMPLAHREMKQTQLVYETFRE